MTPSFHPSDLWLLLPWHTRYLCLLRKLAYDESCPRNAKFLVPLQLPAMSGTQGLRPWGPQWPQASWRLRREGRVGAQTNPSQVTLARCLGLHPFCKLVTKTGISKRITRCKLQLLNSLRTLERKKTDTKIVGIRRFFIKMHIHSILRELKLGWLGSRPPPISIDRLYIYCTTRDTLCKTLCRYAETTTKQHCVCKIVACSI